VGADQSDNEAQQRDVARRRCVEPHHTRPAHRQPRPQEEPQRHEDAEGADRSAEELHLKRGKVGDHQPGPRSFYAPAPAAARRGHSQPALTASLLLGIDVGSTTVKVTAVDPDSLEIRWSRYVRHQTRQAECVRDLLVEVGDAFPACRKEDLRVFVTGSGAGPLVEPLGAKFVQEVNAVTMAVERLHPDAGSVIELGGQDAKIIILRVDPRTGERRTQASMNDKCASGTGATIDKCMIKVGMAPDAVANLAFDAARLHHVAGKCGVFAETDIVNLVKSGIPSGEIMNSLADAIVAQNLSVLTRGHTLRHRVLLLGGPNTYLPFLRECWRLRIREAWDERGYAYPTDTPIEELIVVPEHAQYFAAYGAVVFGIHEPAGVGRYRGLEPLRQFVLSGRKAALGAAAGPALTSSEEEYEAFREQYRIPRFQPPPLEPQKPVRAVIGLDGGSTSSKAVLIDEDGRLLAKAYRLSEGNPIVDMKHLLQQLRAHVEDQGASLEVVGFGVTGYAGDVLDRALGADANVVETVAHMASAVHTFGTDVDVVCDVGGQDIKVLMLQRGEVRNFRLSNQCSAGNGMLLQAMADQFGIPVTEYADRAFEASLAPRFSYGCAVFLDADRVNFQKMGFSRDEMLAGLALVLPKNVWQYVVQIPRMAELGRRFVLQGGTQHNLAALKAQVDYIRSRVPDAEVLVHPHAGEAGALGAAHQALRVVSRRGSTRFVGLDAAIDLAYSTRNDASTRCGFCPNNCSRTFVDTFTPSGQRARYISGFSCEKGTVEDVGALRRLQEEQRQRRSRFPNLVEFEASLCFKSVYQPRQLPEPGAPIDDLDVRRGLFGRVRRVSVRRPFQRSSASAAARRRGLRIGIPRVLNLWSTAPFFRAYFEALGVIPHGVVFSDVTSEALWQAGGKYGSVDPCYPAKVAQAHVHNLLFTHHTRRSLDYVFFPCLTTVPTFVEGVMDTATCPVVAGTPKVIRAAFTKEVDFFATRGIEYLDPALTLTEPAMLKRQLFETFGPRLDVTEDESDFAAAEGFAALELFDRRLQERGREILEEVERTNRIALLLIGRPYHLDPGLNHGILEEFQALGYPILSIRSIPKDPVWLRRFFGADLGQQHVASPLEVNDVWPENYSVNSVQKVWAARFAARHPNVAVLDLSSFKCGHDAPTYGIIDRIVTTAGRPFSALHDVDANRPGGSIAIRVRTYAHTLRLREEALEDLAQKKAELARRLDEKRQELLARAAAR
jgi:activator of 2-hydroxyglutaryl-CoA dehydratase/predicted nucleotide-binding protein (sugar kinase/HSP70/actin superfamily)